MPYQNQKNKINLAQWKWLAEALARDTQVQGSRFPNVAMSIEVRKAVPLETGRLASRNLNEAARHEGGSIRACSMYSTWWSAWGVAEPGQAQIIFCIDSRELLRSSCSHTHTESESDV